VIEGRIASSLSVSRRPIDRTCNLSPESMLHDADFHALSTTRILHLWSATAYCDWRRKQVITAWFSGGFRGLQPHPPLPGRVCHVWNVRTATQTCACRQLQARSQGGGVEAVGRPLPGAKGSLSRQLFEG